MTQRLSILVAVTVVAAQTLGAQSLEEIVPKSAPSCALASPPANAGLAPTPGGFVMVHPRTEGLTEKYTGCKVLGGVDVDRMLRLATLYFEGGVLARAVAHDVRDPKGGMEGACDLKSGKSLLPNSGRKFDDAACKDVKGEEMYGLRVATWPRRCLTDTDAAVCKQDPK